MSHPGGNRIRYFANPCDMYRVITVEANSIILRATAFALRVARSRASTIRRLVSKVHLIIWFTIRHAQFRVFANMLLAIRLAARLIK